MGESDSTAEQHGLTTVPLCEPLGQAADDERDTAQRSNDTTGPDSAAQQHTADATIEISIVHVSIISASSHNSDWRETRLRDDHCFSAGSCGMRAAVHGKVSAIDAPHRARCVPRVCSASRPLFLAMSAC